MFFNYRKSKIKTTESFIDGIVDAHIHIIPGVDDGAVDIEISRKMLQTAYNAGTRVILTTSHFHPGKMRCDEEQYWEQFKIFHALVEKEFQEMRVVHGRELFCNHELLERLSDNPQQLMIANTRQVLVEFDPLVDWNYLVGMIKQIQYEGFTVILAHAERYECLVKKIENLLELRRMRVVIQVNGKSVVGKHERTIQKFVSKLIKNGWVDFVASDAHNIEERSPRLDETATFIEDHFGKETVKALLMDNPLRIIEGKYMEE